MVMDQKRLLMFLPVPFVVLGMGSGMFISRDISEPIWWTLSTNILLSAAIFYCYRQDSNRRSYKRSALLNVGVVALAPLAIPYYVVRSRPRGVKAKAFGMLVACSLMLVVMAIVGGIAVGLIG